MSKLHSLAEGALRVGVLLPKSLSTNVSNSPSWSPNGPWGGFHLVWNLAGLCSLGPNPGYLKE